MNLGESERMTTVERSGSPAVRVVRSAYGSEPQHFGDLRLPPGPGPFPVVLLIHGGFWRAHRALDMLDPLADDLVERGIASWNVEYRRVANRELGVPGDPGAGWPGTLADLAAAADHLVALARDYPLDLDRVIAAGHSAGGHLALWLAGRHRAPAGELAGAVRPVGGLPQLAGAVSLAGVIDLAESWRRNLGAGAVAGFLGGDPQSVPDRYAAACPARRLPIGVPQILVHGTADEHVPVEISRRYADQGRAAGDPITVLEFAGLDHFAVIDPAAAPWRAAVATFEKLIGR